MGLPEAERMKELADPAVRAVLDERARSKEAGVFRGLSHWRTYVIGDTYAPANEGCAFRTVADKHATGRSSASPGQSVMTGPSHPSGSPSVSAPTDSIVSRSAAPARGHVQPGPPAARAQ